MRRAAPAGTPVVLEFGAASFRAGLAAELAPSQILSSTGNEQTGFSDKLSPAISQLCTATVGKADLGNHAAVIPTTPLASREELEACTEVFFEEFSAGMLHLPHALETSLFSSGRTHGVSVESGQDTTLVACIWRGHAFNSSLRQIAGMAGRDCDEAMLAELKDEPLLFRDASDDDHDDGGGGDDVKNGSAGARTRVVVPTLAGLSPAALLDTARRIKEQHSFIPTREPPRAHVTRHREGRVYYLPDGTGLRIPNLVAACLHRRIFKPPPPTSSAAEAAAGKAKNKNKSDDESKSKKGDDEDHPALGELHNLGPHQPPLHAWVNDAVINGVPANMAKLRLDMFRNVVPGGGNTMHEGFCEALEEHVDEASPPMIMGGKVVVDVDKSRDRQYRAWAGGSVLAALDGLVDRSVTKAEYEEMGRGRALEKCC
eukprot:g5797.t1